MTSVSAPPRVRGALEHSLDGLGRRVGGRKRAEVIVLLAAVLGLNTADTATVGAAAGELERGLHLSHADIGIVVGVGALVGAFASVPIGGLADRVPRVRLLTAGIVLWSLAAAANGFATSFEMLVMTRLVLGALAAVAGPVLASLIGDLFTPAERGRVYGWILSGEFVGAGLGFIAGGTVAGLLSWRWSFWLLSIPGFLLALVVRRGLGEPDRGGRDRLVPEGESRAASDVHPDEEPRPDVSLRDAVRRVLSIRSNRLLILASALGYFYLTGAQTFIVVLLRHRFGLSQAAASGLLLMVGVGAVAGVLLGGRASDRLQRRRADARVLVPAMSYGAAVVILVPALLVSTLTVALPLIVLAVAVLSAANPALDAARLDIVPSWLWGRAEAIRSVLRQLATAFAPFLFGLLANTLGGGRTTGFGSGTHGVAAGDLHDAFLIMLVPLLASAAILWHSRRSYPADAEAAAQ